MDWILNPAGSQISSWFFIVSYMVGQIFILKTSAVRDRCGDYRRAVSDPRFHTQGVHKHIAQCGQGNFTMTPFLNWKVPIMVTISFCHMRVISLRDLNHYSMNPSYNKAQKGNFHVSAWYNRWLHLRSDMTRFDHVSCGLNCRSFSFAALHALLPSYQWLQKRTQMCLFLWNFLCDYEFP